MKHIIGIDIGGTNTDLVLLNARKQILASTKVETSIPLEHGVATGILQLLDRLQIPLHCITHIFIGTTHALNALLGVESLLPIGLIRLAGHKPRIPAGLKWNSALKMAVLRSEETISGGFECHGKPLSPFQRDEMKRAVDRLLGHGAEGVAIVSCFGSLYPDHEHEALDCLREHVGDGMPVTLSSSIGGIGFLERENATILNTALHHVISSSFSSLETVMQRLGLKATIALVQNDGSQMTLEEAKRRPILTLTCGPINSAKGGMLLSGHQSCVVVDIGGTSTDIVTMHDGFVKRSSGIVSIADVRMRFPCPDVLSLALGGGSIVNRERCTVGPKSVGRLFFREAQSFGGSTLTITDLGLLLNLITIDGADLSRISCAQNEAIALLAQAADKVAHGVRLVRGEDQTKPCVLVGGGAPLFQKLLANRIHHLVEPSDTGLLGAANALGAAHSKISGRFDGLLSLQERQKALDQALTVAKEEAIRKGARAETIRVGEFSIEPVAYSKDKIARVCLSVTGEA